MLNFRLGVSRLFAPRSTAPVLADEQSVRVTLPADVRGMINSAGLNIRPARPEDGPKVLLCIEGYSPFYYTEDGFAKFMRNHFLELSENQIAMAVQRMGFRVRADLREANEWAWGKSNSHCVSRSSWMWGY